VRQPLLVVPRKGDACIGAGDGKTTGWAQVSTPCQAFALCALLHFINGVLSPAIFPTETPLF
jgi:hypothetical protein